MTGGHQERRLERMTAGDTETAPDGTEIVLGEVGTSVVFENERVRVWEVVLEPGQTQSWHLHDHPYLIVAIEGAKNRMDFLDGGEPREVHETPGRVVYREAGRTHMLTNHGTTRYVNRLVELKAVGEADGHER
jgi:quercetin dioxygenase-like cupin family protein